MRDGGTNALTPRGVIDHNAADLPGAALQIKVGKRYEIVVFVTGAPKPPDFCQLLIGGTRAREQIRIGSRETAMPVVCVESVCRIDQSKCDRHGNSVLRSAGWEPAGLPYPAAIAFSSNSKRCPLVCRFIFLSAMLIRVDSTG